MTWLAIGTTAAVTAAGTAVYSATQGGGGGYSGPASAIQRTTGGVALEKSLGKSIKNDLFPANLASMFLGDAKKMFQTRKKVSSRVLTSSAAGGPDRAISGNIGKGLLAETSSRLEEAPAGQRQVGQAKRKFSLDRLNNLQNFINMQSGASIVQTQANLIGKEIDQSRGAQQGAAYGSIAQLLAAGAVLR